MLERVCNAGFQKTAWGSDECHDIPTAPHFLICFGAVMILYALNKFFFRCFKTPGTVAFHIDSFIGLLYLPLTVWGIVIFFPKLPTLYDKFPDAFVRCDYRLSIAGLACTFLALGSMMCASSPRLKSPVVWSGAHICGCAPHLSAAVRPCAQWARRVCDLHAHLQEAEAEGA